MSGGIRLSGNAQARLRNRRQAIRGKPFQHLPGMSFKQSRILRQMPYIRIGGALLLDLSYRTEGEEVMENNRRSFLKLAGISALGLSSLSLLDVLGTDKAAASSAQAGEEPLVEIRRDGPAFQVVTAKRVLPAARVVLATGGQSYPGCGTSGDGYAWPPRWATRSYARVRLWCPSPLRRRGFWSCKGLRSPTCGSRWCPPTALPRRPVKTPSWR